MTQFQKAELVVSAPDKKSQPDTTLPETVLADRSNVGESSLINAICGRKKLAYTGNTSGKIKLLNFFNLDDKYMFVDVPGYGYTNIPKTQLIKLGQMMEDYFFKRTQKKGIVILVDARHKPADDDMAMPEFARHYETPVVVTTTERDKVPPTKRVHHFTDICKALKLDADEPLFPFSAVERQGVEETWSYLIPLFIS